MKSASALCLVVSGCIACGYTLFLFAALATNSTKCPKRTVGLIIGVKLLCAGVTNIAAFRSATARRAVGSGFFSATAGAARRLFDSGCLRASALLGNSHKPAAAPGPLSGGQSRPDGFHVAVLERELESTMTGSASKPTHTISVRDLVEFVLRQGDLGGEREFVGSDQIGRAHV